MIIPPYLPLLNLLNSNSL